jgi:hypothetical protein
MDAKMINMVCFLGVLACLAATLSRIAMGSAWQVIAVTSGITISVVLITLLCNRYQLYTAITWVLLIMLSDILFPLALFFLGGANSGMAAFFVLSMVAIFFLSRKASRVILLSTHILWVIACYLLYYHYSEALGLTQLNDSFAQTLDNIQSFIISGLFVCGVVLFQHIIFLNEQRIAAEASASLAVQDRLLHVINEA